VLEVGTEQGKISSYLKRGRVKKKREFSREERGFTSIRKKREGDHSIGEKDAIWEFVLRRVVNETIMQEISADVTQKES